MMGSKLLSDNWGPPHVRLTRIIQLVQLLLICYDAQAVAVDAADAGVVQRHNILARLWLPHQHVSICVWRARQLHLCPHRQCLFRIDVLPGKNARTIQLHPTAVWTSLRPHQGKLVPLPSAKILQVHKELEAIFHVNCKCGWQLHGVRGAVCITRCFMYRNMKHVDRSSFQDKESSVQVAHCSTEPPLGA